MTEVIPNLINNLKELSQQNILLAALLFILFRALAIIIPPVMGVMLDILAISIFTWFAGFIFAEIGIMLGAITAFSITRYFRDFLLKRKFFKDNIQRWLNYTRNKETMTSWILLRLVSNPAFDYISYSAGFTNIKYARYMISTFIGNLPTIFIFYYIGGVGLEQGGLGLMLSLLIAILILIFVLFKMFIKKRIDE